MLGDDDQRFLMDRETGEVKLTRGVTDRLSNPALNLQVMVRLTYLVLALDLKDIALTALSFCLSGIPGRRPKEVFCCYSVGTGSGSEPVLSEV